MSLVLLIRFTRPLKDLQSGSEKIAAGHLDHPINVHRRDELGALAAKLLTMRDAVKEKVGSLESEITKIQQVFFNILKNCAEAMQELDHPEEPVFHLRVAPPQGGFCSNRNPGQWAGHGRGNPETII